MARKMDKLEGLALTDEQEIKRDKALALARERYRLTRAKADDLQIVAINHEAAELLSQLFTPCREYSRQVVVGVGYPGAEVLQVTRVVKVYRIRAGLALHFCDDTLRSVLAAGIGYLKDL